MSEESKLVKVYNLTDVSTPTLVQQKLLNSHIAVGTRMCNPGEFVEQEDTPTLRSDCRFLVSVGALSIDALPPTYVAARTAAAAKTGGPLPVHIQHLDVQETKVAQDPPQASVEEKVEPVVAAVPAPQGKNNRR